MTTPVIEMKRAVLLLGLAALFGLPAANAEPVQAETNATPPPVMPHTMRVNDNVMVQSLKGLVFIADEASLKKDGSIAEGIVTQSVPDIDTPAFKALLQPYLGKAVTMADLQEITRETVLYLRQHDRPLVDVMMPEQDISTGTVQVLVLEGRLGKVAVEGNQWFPQQSYIAAIRTKPGEVIAGKQVLSDIGWLNQNPFRQVDLVYARGDAPGKTDIILRAQDRKPWRVYGGIDDTGNELTDQLRLNLGINAGDLFHRGYQANYQLSASPDFNKMVSHAASFVVPFPWRDTLTVFGSYATSTPDLPDNLFVLEGKAWQISGRYQMPLPETETLQHEVTFGLDIKTTNNDLAFGGTQVLAQSTEIIQLLGAYGAHRAWENGSTTSADLTFALSPGGITDRNSDKAYRATRSYASAQYSYANLHVEQVIPLASGITWNLRGTLQWASTNLLPSEQLGLGGVASVRGFEEREVNGDSGLQFSSQWTSPVIKQSNVPGDLRVLAFIDGGQARINEPVPGERDVVNILGAGFGVDYTLGSNVHANLMWGQQLKKSDQSPVDQSGRVHFGITLAY